MDIALLTMDGFQFILRWFHFFFGIIWIGLLYYFNFVQGAFFNEADATTKSNAIQKLVPRALWWFRWGAMWTFVSGWGMLMTTGHLSGVDVFTTTWGVTILTGAALASLMWYNVWFVIWPNQKIVIQSATQAASGGQALPAAAGAAARAGVASRTNVLFSMPMLFFMGAAKHLPLSLSEEPCFGTYAAVTAVILAALEFNALKGKNGPMTSVKGVIHSGVGLLVVFYILLEVCM